MSETAPFPIERKFVSAEIYDAFFAIIDRLEAAIAGETKALKEQRHADLDRYTRQKRQGLLELDRVTRALDNTIPSQDIIARLEKFRETIAVNEKMLTTHLRAAQDVTNLIVQIMRDSESDGTYGRTPGRNDYDLA